jgi:glycosyltransferase involved in cell wall biosynthesis
MEKKLKILMVLPFPRHGKDMRVPPQIGICSYLTNFGHGVDWIIWSDENRDVQRFFLSGIQVFTTLDYNIPPPKFLLSRIFNKIPKTVMRMRSVFKIFKEHKYSIILIRDDVFDGLMGFYIKFIFMLSNPLEQEWEYFKLAPQKPYFLYYLVSKFNKFIATRLLHEADLIIPISKWLGEHLVAQGIPKAKILPVPEGIDVKGLRNQDGQEISKKYNLNNLNVIIYIGTLGKARRLELLIQAFSEVRKKRVDVKLLIVGDGDGKEDLKKTGLELGIDSDVIFTGQVPQSEVPSFIAASDIGVSPVPPFSFYKMSSPIKMFEYMVMGKPVIANEEIPEHKEVLEQSSGGILVPFTSEAFADALIDLLDNRHKGNEMGRNGRKWVVKNRNYEILARQVEARYFELERAV